MNEAFIYPLGEQHGVMGDVAAVTLHCHPHARLCDTESVSSGFK